MRHLAVIFIFLIGIFAGFLFTSAGKDSEESVMFEAVADSEVFVLSDTSFVDSQLRERAEEMSSLELLDLLDKLLASEDKMAVEVFSLLLERDFELAKDYLFKQAFDIRKPTRTLKGYYYDFAEESVPNYVVQGMGLLFFDVWMERNAKECLSFLEARFQDGKLSLSWIRFFFEKLGQEYIRDICFYWEDRILMGEIPEILQYGRYDVYEELYRVKGASVMPVILKIEDKKLRLALFERMIEEMQKTDPEGAIALILSECEGDMCLRLLGKAFDAYVKNNPEDALVFLLNTDLYDQKLSVLYNSFLRSVESVDLLKYLTDDNLSLDEDGKAEIVKQFFLREKDEKSRIVEDEDSYLKSKFADVEAKSLLLDLLPKDERNKLIERIFATRPGDTNLKIYLYSTLSEREQNRYKGSFNECMLFSDHKFALSVYVDRVYKTGDSFKNGGMGFEFVFCRTLEDSDRDWALEFAQNLPDNPLKQYANLLIYVDDNKDKQEELLAYLNAFPEKDMARASFMHIVRNLHKRGNFDSFVNALKETPHEDWVIQSTVDLLFWNIVRNSQDNMLSLIDALENRPNAQEALTRKFVTESLNDSIPQVDARQILDFSLELAPGEETDALIKRALDRYKKANPSEAKQWCEANGVPWNEE